MAAPPPGSCTSCGADLPADAHFCASCGAPAAPPTCSSCGQDVATGSRFCPHCGAALAVADPTSTGKASAPIAERRVTSVLFGDLVGFTPLSESRDAEDVRELLSRYFDECRVVIGRYGGTVEKFIGDAVMAVWGVPVAHEDDAERAVRAGLELVEATNAMGADVGAPGLAMRVGIVTGEVAVTVGATAEGMVAGDAVNTAARVQSAAEPGRVWVDETTRSLTSASISFADTGEHELKGKVEPMRLWQAGDVIAAVRGIQRVDGLEAPLVGRDRELRVVKELFHAAEEAQRPRLVVIDGVPGVGKSRLAWEFEKYIDGLTADVWWHRGRCLSYGDGVAFWALSEAVRARLGLVETDTGHVVEERLDAGLLTFVALEEERDWLRPRLAALIGAESTGSFARLDLYSAWTTFLERLGGGNEPVVLVLDDAHHSDDGLLDFLDHLLGSARAGIFVVVLARPELLARRHDLGGRRTTVVRLEPLSDAAMERLIDGLVDGLPADTREALVRRAEGVPLFAVETVRALIDREAVVPRDGRYVPSDGVVIDLDAVGAPASLQALVAARLDALGPQERRIVADASVLGASFTRDGLLALGSDPDQLDATLASLQRKEILTVRMDRFSSDAGQCAFVQSVVRQVAYGTQSKRDRKSRHLAAVEYLETWPGAIDDLAVVIAQHLLDAVDASSPGDTDVPDLTVRARDMLTLAAERASAVGSPIDAQRIYEAALDRATDAAEQGRLHTALARVSLDAGDAQAAAEHAEQATLLFDGLGDRIAAGVAAAVHANTRNTLQDNATAIDICESRLRTLDGTSGSEEALLLLNRALGRAHRSRGDFDRALRYVERWILLAEALNDYEALADAYLMVADRYSTIGAPLTGASMSEGAARLSREHGQFDMLARALNNLAIYEVGHDLDAALAWGEEGIEAARRSGVSREVDVTTFNYAVALWTAGRLASAQAVVSEAADTMVDPGIRLSLTVVQAWLSDATGGPLPQAVLTEETDSAADLAWMANLEIMQALRRGSPTEAARHAAGSLDDLLAAGGIEDDFMHLWPPMVEAAIDADDLGLAERLLGPVTTRAVGIVSPAVSAHLRRLQGLIGAARGDDPVGVEADLRAGIEALEAFGAIGVRARAQEEFGRWLTSQGRTGEATALLGAAREAYAEIGATGWLALLDVYLTTPQAVDR